MREPLPFPDRTASRTGAARGRRPPAHLGTAGRRLWRAVVDEFAVDEPHRRAVLVVACECLDSIGVARTEIATFGLVVDGGRYGRKTNPAVAVERDQKRLLLTALATLDLDLTATNLVQPGGRP
jgi:phage terminase small subunit